MIPNDILYKPPTYMRNTYSHVISKLKNQLQTVPILSSVKPFVPKYIFNSNILMCGLSVVLCRYMILTYIPAYNEFSYYIP